MGSFSIGRKKEMFRNGVSYSRLNLPYTQIQCQTIVTRVTMVKLKRKINKPIVRLVVVVVILTINHSQ